MQKGWQKRQQKCDLQEWRGFPAADALVNILRQIIAEL
jgi:hypothetical protein